MKTGKILTFYSLVQDFDDTLEKFDEIKNLLESHPEFINFTGKNMPPLHCACITENPKIVKLLLEMGADPNYEYDGKTPLKIAYESGKDELCCLLIENKADPNIIIGRKSILFCAYEDNKMDIFVALLKNGAYVSENAIDRTYKERREDTLNLLLKNGADHEMIRKKGKSILLNSFFKYMKDGTDEYFKRISQSILENKDHQDLSFEGFSLIYFAIKYQRNDMLVILLENNFNPNKISEDGFYTPLHFSYLNDNLASCEILLRYGADPDLKAERGICSVKSVNNYLDGSLLAHTRSQLQSPQNFATCGQEAIAPSLAPPQIATEINQNKEDLNLFLFTYSGITGNSGKKITRFEMQETMSDLHELTTGEDAYFPHYSVPKTNLQEVKIKSDPQKQIQK